MYSPLPLTNISRPARDEERFSYGDGDPGYHLTEAAATNSPIMRPHSATHPEYASRYANAPAEPSQIGGDTALSNPSTLLSYLRNLSDKDRKRLYWYD